MTGKSIESTFFLEQSLDAGAQKRFYELNPAPDQPVIDSDRRGKGTKPPQMAYKLQWGGHRL